MKSKKETVKELEQTNWFGLSSRDSFTIMKGELLCMARKCKSYEELEEALAVLLSPSMTPDALESFLARAMTMAAGHGASAVQDEADEDKA